MALARAARTAGLHAEEEAAHISLWDDFANALGTEAADALPETRCCASAWAAAGDEAGAAAILYAIESGQPAISETKLRGLVEHYGFADGSEAVEYFVLHGERDHEHAAEAHARLKDSEDAELVGLAEAALAANWLCSTASRARNDEARLSRASRLSLGALVTRPWRACH